MNKHDIITEMNNSNVSYNTAKHRLTILNGKTEFCKRIRELISDGNSFATAKRIALAERKGITIHANDWNIDKGYKYEDYKSFILIRNPQAIGGYEVYNNHNRLLKPYLVNNRIQYIKYDHNKWLQDKSRGKHKGGGCRYVSLAILVYLNFVNDEIPAGYIVDHIDNDPTNNDPKNLQLLTRTNNLMKNSRWGER